MKPILLLSYIDNVRDQCLGQARTTLRHVRRRTLHAFLHAYHATSRRGEPASGRSPDVGSLPPARLPGPLAAEGPYKFPCSQSLPRALYRTPIPVPVDAIQGFVDRRQDLIGRGWHPQMDPRYGALTEGYGGMDGVSGFRFLAFIILILPLANR